MAAEAGPGLGGAGEGAGGRAADPADHHGGEAGLTGCPGGMGRAGSAAWDCGESQC